MQYYPLYLKFAPDLLGLLPVYSMCHGEDEQSQTLACENPSSAISSPRILYHTAVRCPLPLQVEIQFRNESLTSVLKEAKQWFGRCVELEIAASGKHHRRDHKVAQGYECPVYAKWSGGIQ